MFMFFMIGQIVINVFVFKGLHVGFSEFLYIVKWFYLDICECGYLVAFGYIRWLHNLTNDHGNTLPIIQFHMPA